MKRSLFGEFVIYRVPCIPRESTSGIFDDVRALRSCSVFSLRVRILSDHNDFMGPVSPWMKRSIS
jgi:hypothetical protein